MMLEALSQSGWAPKCGPQLRELMTPPMSSASKCLGHTGLAKV